MKVSVLRLFWFGTLGLDILVSCLLALTSHFDTQAKVVFMAITASPAVVVLTVSVIVAVNERRAAKAAASDSDPD